MKHLINCLLNIGLMVSTINNQVQASPYSYADIRASVSIVGSAKLSVLFWDIYESELFTSTGHYDPQVDQSVLFDIRYLRDIKAKDLIEKTKEQWQHLDIPEQTYTLYLAQLETLWPDIKKGDSLSLFITQGKSLFYFNRSYLGAIEGTTFGPLFLSIWLSPSTSQPKLRKRLLGGVK